MIYFRNYKIKNHLCIIFRNSIWKSRNTMAELALTLIRKQKQKKSVRKILILVFSTIARLKPSSISVILNRGVKRKK